MMGVSININARNEDEFNQQMQQYLAQGYRMQSNFNGTAILNKKSYSVGLLILLILFFFPAAIIYYFVASDDVVTIRISDGQSPANNTNAGPTTGSFDYYCEECGRGLFKDSNFCPGCGRDLTETEEEPVKTISEESMSVEEVEEEIFKCKNCGTELTVENNFCTNCGESLDVTEE